MVSQQLLKKLICAGISVLCLSGQTRASDFSLHDWQPCSTALEDANGQEPQEDAKWSLVLSPYTHHWRTSDEHKHVRLGALERNVRGGRFCGLALFNNSFGQPSAYVYVGKQWNGWIGDPKWFVKVSAGVIHGYKDEHKDALTYNHSGFAPVAIPAVGYDFTSKDSANVTLLGTAGVLFAYGHKF